jgi:serine/threonine protein kinase
MSLPAGARLGPYEVIAPLGAGGMGEVYKARDTRLDRTVAVKVLPTRAIPTEAERQRFVREARAISQLQHPHICALFDVGREGETDFLVMELVDGESLQARLARGPLPVQDVLRHGAEIASALDRAHKNGIVHRDLKPGNVLIDEHGRLYLSGSGGVWVVDKFGVSLGLIPVPDLVSADGKTPTPGFCSNVTFGGPEGKTLYLTCKEYLYSLAMTVRGGQFVRKNK